MKICPKCKNAVDDRLKFCPLCGSELAEMVPKEGETAQKQPGKPMPDPGINNPQAVQTINKTLVWIIAGTAAIIIILLFVLIVVISSKNPSESKNGNDDYTVSEGRDKTPDNNKKTDNNNAKTSNITGSPDSTSKNTDAEKEDKESSSKDTEPSSEDTEPSSEDTRPSEPDDNSSINVDGGFIPFNTDMYSLTLPEKWQTTVQTSINPGEYNDYFAGFYHADSNAANMGGYLFGINMFMDGDESYKDYPSYRVIGRIIYRQAEAYTVVAVFPTDVQYNESTAAEYRELYDQIDSILDSFEANSMYGFERY